MRDTKSTKSNQKLEDPVYASVSFSPEISWVIETKNISRMDSLYIIGKFALWLVRNYIMNILSGSHRNDTNKTTRSSNFQPVK